MDSSSGECVTPCKSPPTSQSSIESIAEEIGAFHECPEEKQNSSKRKSPMDLASQGKRCARSPRSVNFHFSFPVSILVLLLSLIDFLPISRRQIYVKYSCSCHQ
ncbi:hypothetical protein GCK32_022079 [Trichostrongylus colubriformis]|uniref:Uncharacterized protein n=1 Tax=Trichostrongylus colubriformis TaxID=6319 RepID=A0AAN8FFI7_TRICO